ncbi:hypothetical protein Droror1_Dr00020310 [Drosera rotundifolia]
MWKRLKHGNITREKVPERLISSISSPALGSESSPEGSIPRLISAAVQAVNPLVMSAPGKRARNRMMYCDGEHGMKLPQSRADLIPPSHLTNRATSTAQFSGSNNFFTVFYGNVDFYVLFRFHHKLYERILASKVISSAKEQKGSKDHDPSGVYTSLFHLSFSLSQQLLKVVANEKDTKLIQLFENEKSRELGEVSASVYLEQSSSPAQLKIWLMDNSQENAEVAMTGPTDPTSAP